MHTPGIQNTLAPGNRKQNPAYSAYMYSGGDGQAACDFTAPEAPATQAPTLASPKAPADHEQNDIKMISKQIATKQIASSKCYTKNLLFVPQARTKNSRGSRQAQIATQYRP